jgi:hypothetical protein
MSMKIITFGILASCMLIACENKNTTKTDKQETKKEELAAINTDIPFTELKNYFVKNDYKDAELQGIKIKTQSDFDKIFGMAPTMGEGAQPLLIDFATQYVIALIAKTSDNDTKLAINSLNKKDNNILLTYNQTVGEKQSYTSRHVKLLLVDNKYQGELEIQKK